MSCTRSVDVNKDLAQLAACVDGPMLAALLLQICQTNAEKLEQKEQGVIFVVAVVLVVAQSPEEQQCRKLQEQLAQTIARLDSDRITWRKQADEVHAELLKVEQQKLEAALQAQAEEHKRQQHRLLSERKRSLMKANESRAKSHELRKRVSQLQSEKATAIRLPLLACLWPTL
eukprot:s3422_g6.t1